MNAESLLSHYEKIADAPGAIARLRRFILDLSVRGKLVPQDVNDEPASELLKRIAEEKARLLKAGSAKSKGELFEPIPAEEPWEIPKTWTWARLGNVLQLIKNGLNAKPGSESFASPASKLSLTR